MELHAHPHRFAHRWPDWRAAAIASLAAGLAFMFVEMVALWLMDESPWVPLRMVAAMVLGRNVLSDVALDAGSTLLVGLVVHFGLSVAFGLILAVIMASFSLDSSVGIAALVGAAFGAAVYWINLYGMSQVFPWFAEARGALAFLAHQVFGLVAAVYMALEKKIEG